MVKFILALLFSFCVALHIQAQQSPIEARFQALLKEAPAVGFSIAVVKHKKITETYAFGYKNIQHNQPLTSDNVFRIASISKSFVATAIMQLVEKGKLQLTDDVSDLIGFTVRNPLFPHRAITLEMLLSHTSSLNDKNGYFSLDAIHPQKNDSAFKSYNNYEPGKGYQYCNLNFNMAGAIIERVTGERFDRYVKKNILKPLKLYGGHNINELDSSRFATLYEYQRAMPTFIPQPNAYISRKNDIENNYVLGYSTPVFSPTGGMKISAPDLARYLMMHMYYGKGKGRRIISKKSSKLMQQPRSQQEQYGLALLQTSTLIPGETMVGHTGAAYGLYSAMFFEPHKKFGIVVITNGCHPAYADGFNTVLKKAVNIVYEECIKK